MNCFCVCKKKKEIEFIFMDSIGFIDSFHHMKCFCINSGSFGFNSPDLGIRRGLLKPIKLQYDWIWNFKFNMSKILGYISMCSFVFLCKSVSPPVRTNIDEFHHSMRNCLTSICESFPFDKTDWFISFKHFNQMSTFRWWHRRDVSLDFDSFEKKNQY